MAATGDAVIDFGAGNQEASVVVLTPITAGAKAEAFVMADATTADHTANDHKYFAMLAGLTCGDIVPGVSFTIHARAIDKLTKTFSLCWVWTE